MVYVQTLLRCPRRGEAGIAQWRRACACRQRTRKWGEQRRGAPSAHVSFAVLGDQVGFWHQMLCKTGILRALRLRMRDYGPLNESWFNIIFIFLFLLCGYFGQHWKALDFVFAEQALVRGGRGAASAQPSAICPSPLSFAGQDDEETVPQTAVYLLLVVNLCV